MDLSTFDTRKKAEEGVDMPILSPVDRKPILDEAGQPVSIKLIGQDSKEFQSLTHKLRTRRLNTTVRAGGRPKVSSEELEKEAMDLLVACTKGWAGIVVEGKAVPFSPDAARDLYTRFPWIREQVDEFTSDRANFLGN